jgi:NAD-dependent epimerase/dehydratase family protein
MPAVSKACTPSECEALKRSTVLQRPGSAMDLGGCVFKMRYLVTGDSGFNGSNRRRGCARRGERFGLRDPSCGANFSPALGGPAARNESSQYRWHAQRTNCSARRWLGACCVRGVVCSVWRNPGPAESGTMPAEPISPYGVSKYVGELYARVFTKTYGLETACIRHFNVFGPRQGPSSQYSGLLSRFMLGARRRRSRRKSRWLSKPSGAPTCMALIRRNVSGSGARRTHVPIAIFNRAVIDTFALLFGNNVGATAVYLIR